MNGPLCQINVILSFLSEISRMNWLIPVFLFSIAGCVSGKNPLHKEVKLLRKGIIRDDTSYIYALPYEPGKSHYIVQGYFGPFSHKERAALDFKMKRGSKVLAAREGVVVRVKQDGDRGGWSKKYRPYGNNIVIQHPDGTRAGYWHLQYRGAFVKMGDSVKKGQAIGLSGKTGYAAMPHLHFLVWLNRNNQWQQVPTRFETTRGNIYLRGWKKYRKPTE